jgi:hypothetical protein
VTHRVRGPGSFLRQEIERSGNAEEGRGFFLSLGWVLPTGIGVSFFHQGHELKTRIQLSRERRHLAEGAPRTTRILTIEHQLLLGG